MNNRKRYNKEELLHLVEGNITKIQAGDHSNILVSTTKNRLNTLLKMEGVDIANILGYIDYIDSHIMETEDDFVEVNETELQEGNNHFMRFTNVVPGVIPPLLQNTLTNLKLSKDIVYFHELGDSIKFFGHYGNGIWKHFVSSSEDNHYQLGEYIPPKSNHDHYFQQHWTATQSEGWAIILGSETGYTGYDKKIYEMHIWGKDPEVAAIEKTLYEHLYYVGATKELLTLTDNQKKIDWLAANLIQGEKPWELSINNIPLRIQLGRDSTINVTRPDWDGASNSWGKNPIPWIHNFLEEYLSTDDGENFLPPSTRKWCQQIKTGEGWSVIAQEWECLYRPKYGSLANAEVFYRKNNIEGKPAQLSHWLEQDLDRLTLYKGEEGLKDLPSVFKEIGAKD